MQERQDSCQKNLVKKCLETFAEKKVDSKFLRLKKNLMKKCHRILGCLSRRWMTTTFIVCLKDLVKKCLTLARSLVMS